MRQEIIRHGEVILKPSTLPKDATLQEEKNDIVVAHSETGHHHVLTAPDMSKIKVYMLDGDTYLEVPEVSKLWHQKSGQDVHTPHEIAPGVYKVQIKKEFDYFAGKLRQVRD